MRESEKSKPIISLSYASFRIKDSWAVMWSVIQQSMCKAEENISFFHNCIAFVGVKVEAAYFWQ